MIYTFIDNPTRYYNNMRRGNTVSILSAYITANYLLYIEIKKDYYSKEDILNWLIDRLLLFYNEYFEKRSIIVLNNVSVHVNSRIIKIIQIKDYLVKYLSFYFSNYNLIELIFSVLKTWI